MEPLQPKTDPETDTDLLWAAIAGLRLDIERLRGKFEKGLAVSGAEAGQAEEAAEVWRKARQEQVDRLLADRAKVGKGEDIDADHEKALGEQWMNG